MSTLSGSSVTPDLTVSNNFRWELSGSSTLNNPSNLSAHVGQWFNIDIKQASFAATLSFGSYYKFIGGTPTLEPTAYAECTLTCHVISSTLIKTTLLNNFV